MPRAAPVSPARGPPPTPHVKPTLGGSRGSAPAVGTRRWPSALTPLHLRLWPEPTCPTASGREAGATASTLQPRWAGGRPRRAGRGPPVSLTLPALYLGVGRGWGPAATRLPWGPSPSLHPIFLRNPIMLAMTPSSARVSARPEGPFLPPASVLHPSGQTPPALGSLPCPHPPFNSLLSGPQRPVNPVTALILLSSCASHPEGQGLPVPGAGHWEAFAGMGSGETAASITHPPFTLLVDRAWPIWGL